MTREDPPRAVTPFATGDGRMVYRLPLEVFPGIWGNAYLLDDGDRPILIDCGSGQEASNRCLYDGLAAIRSRFGRRVGLGDLHAVVITHGHIDHFGGLGAICAEHDVPVAVHVLDRRVVSAWEERTVVVSKRVERYLAQAGVGAERRDQYMSMYLTMKRLFRSLPVDQTFEEGSILDGALVAVHTPGHCPGQVCLQVGSLLLTADHVLPGITPHLSPEALTGSTGLGHYLDSLARIRPMAAEASCGLGGHGGRIRDVSARVDASRRHHEARLDLVLDACRAPRTLVELSRTLFGEVHSYHVLLAILEAGAHVEYLHRRGALAIENLEAFGNEAEPVIRYRRT